MTGERAFYTLDADLRFRGAGVRALQWWGKTERELIGRNIVEVFPRMAGGPVHEALLEALRTVRAVRVQAPSIALGVPMVVEIYPVHGGLQVTLELLARWPASR